jgi:hypothetical protein
MPRDDCRWLVCREHNRLPRDHCRLAAKSNAIITYDSTDNAFRIDSTALLNLTMVAVNELAREHGQSQLMATWDRPAKDFAGSASRSVRVTMPVPAAVSNTRRADSA